MATETMERQAEFTCHDCGQIKPVQTTGGTGYASDGAGNKTCYECCGKADAKYMRDHDRMTLYLAVDHESLAANNTSHEFMVRHRIHHRNYGWKVTNWPGTLRMNGVTVSKGRHNIAGSRYDCWFTGPDGAKWHGVQYGEMTQILHCRKLKSKS